MERDESQQGADLTGASQPSTTPTQRLVIRVKIVPEDPPQVTPARGPLNKRALALVSALGILGALLLTWVFTSVLRSDRTPAASTVSARSDHVESPPRSRSPTGIEASPPMTREPSSTVAPAAETAAPPTAIGPRSGGTTPADAYGPSTAPPMPIDEVIPSVPQSALQTIRGTVRVTIRVTIDERGTVTGATAQIPGPSRYFERLSLEAARKWTFTPANTQEQRVMLVRFYYTPRGATARSEPP